MVNVLRHLLQKTEVQNVIAKVRYNHSFVQLSHFGTFFDGKIWRKFSLI